MEMECELLISNFKGPKTIALVKESIGRISDGSSSYRAGALKIGLKKAFELKRQGYARLRCRNTRCLWNNKGIPYSSVGSSIYCPTSGDHLVCIGCGSSRIGNLASCQYCRKRFI